MGRLRELRGRRNTEGMRKDGRMKTRTEETCGEQSERRSRNGRGAQTQNGGNDRRNRVERNNEKMRG